eukprot:gb/GECG01015057.1/.p1 GENE.gb/GECG01015057.1/~~gb/GECG01015057.1/.p1  ORF type:complete len:154 (+),score=48.56 gb/GECG01015057.1/:1-462(+)
MENITDSLAKLVSMEEEEEEEEQQHNADRDSKSGHKHKNTDDRDEQQRIIDTTTKMLEEQEKAFEAVEGSQTGLRDTLKKAIADIRQVKEELQRGPNDTDDQKNADDIMAEAGTLFNDICGRASEIDAILRETDDALNNTVNLVAEGSKKAEK